MLFTEVRHGLLLAPEPSGYRLDHGKSAAGSGGCRLLLCMLIVWLAVLLTVLLVLLLTLESNGLALARGVVRHRFERVDCSDGIDGIDDGCTRRELVLPTARKLRLGCEFAFDQSLATFLPREVACLIGLALGRGAGLLLCGGLAGAAFELSTFARGMVLVRKVAAGAGHNQGNGHGAWTFQQSCLRWCTQWFRRTRFASQSAASIGHTRFASRFSWRTS